MRVDDSDSVPRGPKWWHLILYMVATLAAIVLAMWLWKVLHVDPWTLGVGHRYSQVGAFGDSFSPIVGAISALALGAAIASVFMQRSELALQRAMLTAQFEEFKNASRHLADQAAATAEQIRQQQIANTIAQKQADSQDEANVLARVANSLEVHAQIARIDAEAADIIRERLQTLPLHAPMFAKEPMLHGHPETVWLNLQLAENLGHLGCAFQPS